MRILLQRVTHASVHVDNQPIADIGPGYLLLVGIAPHDTTDQSNTLAKKIATLRLFPDERGRFDRSLLDVNGHALVVSQFTLFADTRKGRRPSFSQAATPDHAASLVDHFANQLRELGVTNVATGQFGADMHVNLCNQGPVTLWLDTDHP